MKKTSYRTWLKMNLTPIARRTRPRTKSQKLSDSPLHNCPLLFPAHLSLLTLYGSTETKSLITALSISNSQGTKSQSSSCDVLCLQPEFLVLSTQLPGQTNPLFRINSFLFPPTSTKYLFSKALLSFLPS